MGKKSWFQILYKAPFSAVFSSMIQRLSMSSFPLDLMISEITEVALKACFNSKVLDINYNTTFLLTLELHLCSCRRIKSWTQPVRQLICCGESAYCHFLHSWPLTLKVIQFQLLRAYQLASLKPSVWRSRALLHPFNLQWIWVFCRTQW